MRKIKARLGIGLAGTVTALALLAPGAQAATQFGSTCAANSGEEAFSIWSAAHAPGDPLPVTAPISGVITSWTFNGSGLGLEPGTLSQAMQVFRTVGPGVTQVVGESPLAILSGGVDTFPTRVPVQAGDFVGNTGDVATFYCSTGNPADAVGYFKEVAKTPFAGQSFIEPNYKAAVSAKIEPDGDKDGFGDETQDLCPQSALFQAACPVVTLDSFAVTGAKSVTVYVIGSLATKVKMSGSVKLGKGSKAKLGPLTKSVAPGAIAKFKLKFPGPLKEKLKELGPGEKLTVKLTASATNLAGAPTVKKLSVKLKGQG